MQVIFMGDDNNKSIVLSINDLISDHQSSIEIAKTSKSTTYKVKIYATDPDIAKIKAMNIFDELEKKYLVNTV